MSNWQAPSTPNPVHATVTIPGSKSLTNRALVLAALGIAPDQVNAVLAARDRPDVDGKALIASLGPTAKGATVEPSKAFRLSVGIQFDSGVRTTAEIVVLLADDGDEPYRVLSWRDDFDQIASAGG